jgi:hypothetical protein
MPAVKSADSKVTVGAKRFTNIDRFSFPLASVIIGLTGHT